jgi:hypothetical protein
MKNKNFLPENFVLFIVAGIFLGCMSTPKSTSIQAVNPVEVLGKTAAPFQGRLIKIESKGNEFTEADTVRENALIRATWETYKLGYEYFIIISEDAGAFYESFTTAGNAITRFDASGNVYTTYNPGHTYNSTRHYVIIIIMACSADELPENVPTFSVNSRLPQAQSCFDNDNNKGRNNGK